MENKLSLAWRLVLTLVFIVSLGLVAATPASAAGNIIYVKAAATGADSGTSWDDAFTDLQSALKESVSGDQIWVAEGTY